MKAYIVVTAKPGTARDLTKAVAAMPGGTMADACWGVGDVYAVVQFSAWNELDKVVLDKIHALPGVIWPETHVAVEG